MFLLLLVVVWTFLFCSSFVILLFSVSLLLCEHGCVLAWMCVSMDVCACAWMRAHVCVCAWKCVSMDVCVCACAGCVCVCMCVCDVLVF